MPTSVWEFQRASPKLGSPIPSLSYKKKKKRPLYGVGKWSLDLSWNQLQVSLEKETGHRLGRQCCLTQLNQVLACKQFAGTEHCE